MRLKWKDMTVKRKGRARAGVIAWLLASSLALAGCGRDAGGGRARGMIMPSADGEETLTAQDLVIDISHLDLGYMMVCYTGEASRLFVQLVGPDGEEYKYFLDPSPDYVTLPLTAGDGEYYLCAYENVGGDQYSPILAQMLQLQLSDEFAPFLCPNQYVDFTPDDQAVSLAKELTEETEDELEQVGEIYHWVIRNISYDYEKAVDVSPGYLPDIEETLKIRTGICFDFAALMTAMLRSLGIPTKLNIGYLTEDVYHAWISIYLEETGWIDQIILFDGKDWRMMDPTVASSGGTGEVEELASDDANYIVRYVR